MNTNASTVVWRRAEPALAPPVGFRLARAVGLTYSLDLTTLASALEAMAGGAEPPLALADRVTVVGQASRLRAGAAPREEHRLLDKAVRTIALPEGAFFHPKVWLLKFTDGAATRWRLIVGSLNASETPDAFEVSVVLEGENAPGPELNGELIAFLRAALAGETGLDAFWAELSRVRFAPPPGFTGWRFAGQRGLPHPETLFPPLAVRAIVSPALADEALERFLENAPAGARPLLVSTKAGLDGTSPALLERFDARLMPDAVGLHAKALLGEREGRTELWLGSANATMGSWFGTNAECMVALECDGYAVERVLGELPGLVPYRRVLDEAGEAERKKRKERNREVERYLGYLNRAAWSARFDGGRAELRFETSEKNPLPGATATVGLLGHPARMPLGNLTGTGRLLIEGVDERSRTEFASIELSLENPARVSRFLMRAPSTGYFLR